MRIYMVVIQAYDNKVRICELIKELKKIFIMILS